MVTMVIRELNSICRLNIFPETGHRTPFLLLTQAFTCNLIWAFLYTPDTSTNLLCGSQSFIAACSSWFRGKTINKLTLRQLICRHTMIMYSLKKMYLDVYDRKSMSIEKPWRGSTVENRTYMKDGSFCHTLSSKGKINLLASSPAERLWACRDLCRDQCDFLCCGI